MPLLYVCVCCRDQKRVLNGLLLPGTGVTDVYNHHVLGKEPRSFCKTIIHSDISPGPNYRILKKNNKGKC